MVLLDGDASATVGMVFEREVNIMMGALDPRFAVRAETMALLGELHTMGESGRLLYVYTDHIQM